MRWMIAFALLLTSCGAPLATGIGQGVGVSQGTIPPYFVAPAQPYGATVRPVQCITMGWYTTCQ